MTMQSCGINFWPTRVQGASTNSNLDTGAIVFDSITDRIAYVGRSPVVDSISAVTFFMGTTTTGCVMSVRIESVLNGRPSGTLLGTTTEGTVTIADTDDNVWKTVTLTAAASVSVGTEFAILFSYSSGTTPNLQFRGATQTAVFYDTRYPVVLQDTGAGAWTILTQALAAIVQMTTAGVVALQGLIPQQGSGTIPAFNSASTPNEYAMKFVAPFKCRLIGAVVMMFNPAAGSDFSFSLWPTTSSVNGDALAQTVIDGDYAIGTTTDGHVSVFFGPIELTAGSTYYLGVRADTANNLSVGYIRVNTAISNAIRGFPIGPNVVHLASRTWTAGTASAWTDAPTDFIIMSFIFDQLDDGAGGGGGGMRLAGHGGLAA